MADLLASGEILGDLSPDDLRTCPLCGKPFNLTSSYNRHLSYCRRSQSRPKSRRKSCRVCSIAKAKCSFTNPCSRCNAKGIDCAYDHRPVTTRGASMNAEVQAIPGPTASFANRRDLSISRVNSTGDDLALSIANFETIDQSLPDVDGLDRNGLEMTFDWFEGEISPSDGAQLHIDPNLLASDDVYVADRNPSKVLGFLMRTPSPTTLALQSANLLLESLCAIPEQILRQSTFPVFVHPHWSPLVMPEALVVCMQLARLFASRAPDIKPFIWRTIVAEQKQTLEALHSFSKQDLLAIMQTHMIYLVMRVVDRGTRSDSWNHEMITSLDIICERFLFLCGGRFSEDEQSNPSVTWEDWIFAESRRRTACVWFLMNRIIVVKTLAGCPTTEQPWTLPLPSPKTQWEARSRTHWIEEMEAGRLSISTFGELLESRKRYNEAIHAQRLDTWNASIDNLGSLLNISVTMM